MASLPARAFAAYCRLVIRRRDWGTGAALARRARRVFGAPPALQRHLGRGLQITPVADRSGVRGEWLVAPTAAPPDDGVLLHVHGGGYVACSAATQRGLTAALARATGVRVLAADYRLAPEAPFPAALDDVLATYRWLLDTLPRRAGAAPPIAVVGESAGGGLVLALAQEARARGWPPPACVVALSPWTDLAATGASIRGNDGRDAMFRPENMAAFAAAYLAGAAPDDPRASPLYGSAAGLPPVLFQVGDTELLLDDARRLHARIVAAGGESRLSVWADVAHAWHLLAPYIPEADAAVAEAAAFVRAHLAPAARRPPEPARAPRKPTPAGGA